MSISEFFVRRPVMTGLVMIGILFFGVFSYRLMPVAALPNVDFPTVEVTASLAGASPETMASSVATPLEKQFSTIPGLDSMSSISVLGNTRITLQFKLSRDIDAAAQDVQSAISAAQRLLPREMTVPPTFRKLNPADAAIFYLALTSETLPLSAVDEYAQTLLAQRLSTVSGVAQVSVFGSQKYAVRVRLDPKKLAARGIGLDEVEQAIRRQNVNLPTGILQGPERMFTIQASGQLSNAAAYGPLVVAYRNGAPVRLDELGEVADSVEEEKAGAWYNEDRGVVLAIFRQPGTNTVQVVDEIRRILPAFRAQVPPGIRVDVLYDRSQSIRASVQEVQFTLALALALVVMVIFLFLRNLSATVIPSLALPMSLIGTFSVMYLLGFSINNLSLLALVLCVGFVVDDAIVMLENIARHLEMGKSPMQATLDGSREIGFTIVSMTLSLAAVFLPIVFMGGILGRLLSEFAVTIMVAVLISGFVSLTLTPLLCGRWLRPERRSRGEGAVYAAVKRGYDASLRWVLRRQGLTLAAFVALTGVTAWMFAASPKGFLPPEDTGRLFAFTEGAEDIAFPAMAAKQAQAAAKIRANPHVESVMSFMGVSGSSTSLNLGRILIILRPAGERPSANRVLEDLRPRLRDIPGLKVFLQNLPEIRLGGRLTKSPYQFTLQSTDTEELYQWAPRVEERLRALPGFRDVTSDLQIRNPEVTVRIDRQKASALGLTAEQIETALFNAYGSRQVSTIYTPANDYAVIMELLPRYQAAPDALSALYVRAQSGQLVPLSTVAEIGQGVGPLSINHAGQLPSVTLSFDLEPGFALSHAVREVDAAMRELRAPASLLGSFQGTAQAFKESLADMELLLALSIFVIYLVLGILYESYLHPLTILA
ncbi:MAG TPA: efflux RND transporter permease subunit, partial [Burkholderiales bacterium]|nr:efflux RND transporter permease subunit [Burkholderiales bacterium]